MILWLSTVVVFFFPFWLPIYLCFTSTTRTFNLIKNVIRFTTSIWYESPTEPLPYAILKGNGKYVKDHDENVLINQLYDYTVRSKYFFN